MSWLPDWLTGYNRDDYEEGQRADAANRALTESLHDRGLINERDFNTAITHYDASAEYDPDAEIQGAFDQELDKRTKGLRDFGTGAIGASLSALLGSVPWQVWLGVAAYAAWRMGFFKGLVKR